MKPEELKVLIDKLLEKKLPSLEEIVHGIRFHTFLHSLGISERQAQTLKTQNSTEALCYAFPRSAQPKKIASESPANGEKPSLPTQSNDALRPPGSSQCSQVDWAAILDYQIRPYKMLYERQIETFICLFSEEERILVRSLIKKDPFAPVTEIDFPFPFNKDRSESYQRLLEDYICYQTKVHLLEILRNCDANQEELKQKIVLVPDITHIPEQLFNARQLQIRDNMEKHYALWKSILVAIKST